MERQLANRIEDIRADHVNRYRFATTRIGPREKVLDAACGCGYGSWMLYSDEGDVTGMDISGEAIDFAKRNWPGPRYLNVDIQQAELDDYDTIVCFETIEHLHNADKILRKFRKAAKRLIISTPNEEVIPFNPKKFENDDYPHLTHYTRSQFTEMLEDAGWTVKEVFCQKGKTSDLTIGSDGMFMVFVAE